MEIRINTPTVKEPCYVNLESGHRENVNQSTLKSHTVESIENWLSYFRKVLIGNRSK